MDNLIRNKGNSDEMRDFLYSKYKRNPKIIDEISERNERVEKINKQMLMLGEKLNDVKFELRILQEIKDSQKIFISIENEINNYLNLLKDENRINRWYDSYLSDKDKSCLRVKSIKNASYSGTIIINNNKDNGFFRVTAELSISPVLLNLAKKHKGLFRGKEDVKLIKEGKVLFEKEQLNLYINQIEGKFKFFFRKERNDIISTFKDVEDTKYSAYDFIMYDDILIDGFSTVKNNNILDNKEEEIPF